MSQAVDYTAQVSIILAAPVLDTILQKMYPVFSADQGRFRAGGAGAPGGKRALPVCLTTT